MSEPKKNEKKAAAGRLGGLIGGRVKSEAKAKAVRINGTAGGKPKGVTITSEHARKAAAGRTAALSPERRREIALRAVSAREAKRKKTSDS